MSEQLVVAIYSIAGEHTVSLSGTNILKTSDEEGDVLDENGELMLSHSALVVTGRIEAFLNGLGVTHCVDLADPEEGDQEEPVPIREFFRRWRTHIVTK